MMHMTQAMRIVSLADMEVEEAGIVHALAGGHQFARRLEAMGIRCGSLLTKVSGSYLGGPVTVRAGNIQIALGHGMASKVMMNVRGKEKEGGRA